MELNNIFIFEAIHGMHSNHQQWYRIPIRKEKHEMAGEPRWEVYSRTWWSFSWEIIRSSWTQGTTHDCFQTCQPRT